MNTPEDPKLAEFDQDSNHQYHYSSASYSTDCYKQLCKHKMLVVKLPCKAGNLHMQYYDLQLSYKILAHDHPIDN
jgi:hypothetical protein